MGEFRQFLTELSALHIAIFSFQDNNLSKSQRRFSAKLICGELV